ncbi:amidohydrolase family protein [Clostridia bacterium OttesenSCG-928-F22]|nr:amidohydrolase family protein [Clostridia bacterium OttesenSCG-928-F22]
MKVLLKSGTIMDGSGEKGYVGDVLLEYGRIKKVSKTPLDADCPTIDCTGKVIAPGFIDAHSHNDCCMHFKDDLPFTEPFIRQGITSYVAGQCGFSIAGVEKGSPYGNETNFFPTEKDGPQYFHTYEEYFDYLRKSGMRQNMAMFAGHGIALGSIVGAEPGGASSPDAKRRTAAILSEGLDAGCKGISFGIAYRPSLFIPDTEIREMAELAIKRNMVVTYHARALGTSGIPWYGNEEPHNLRWTREFLDLFRGSNARLQISHLLFVGETAWPTYEPMFELLQKNIDAGDIDLMFDMFSYTQGATSASMRLPQFFYDNLPQIYTDTSLWPQLEKEVRAFNEGRGIHPEDVLLCNPIDPEWDKYKGMSVAELSDKLGMGNGQFYMELYRRSGGTATLYMLVEQDENKIPLQMQHDKALYMTDAWVVPGSLQSAPAYGSLPKFLRLAREHKQQSMEMTIAKMTGRTADRFDLFGRGYLKDGYAADVVVFDAATVRENATSREPEQFPTGIHHVFINGEHVLNEGTLDASIKAGKLL